MNNIVKKSILGTSLVALAIALTACGGCPEKKAHHKKHMQKPQAVEVVETDTIVVYQTYENADIDKVYAKMYR